MTKAEFCRLHPTVKGTPRFYPFGFDFETLHSAICKSRLLKKMQSLNWLCKNYNVIISGEYDDFETIDLKSDIKSFGCEREFTQDDFENLIDKIENISF